MRLSLILAPFALVAVLAPGLAFAQPTPAPAPARAATPAPAPAPAPATTSPYVETKTDSGYSVWFPVDNLAGGGGPPIGGIVPGNHGAVRNLLMRPRVQFVPEMLKSVEAL